MQHGANKNLVGIWLENFKESEHLLDLGVDGRIILNKA
jgi:hypothetical protein